MGKVLRTLVVVCALIALAGGPVAAQSFDPGLFSGMRWRLVGPFRAGRVLAVTGVPGHPERFYFGSVGGGVWRTDNAGRTWEPIFDSQPIASIGAIAVAPSNPDIIYVGSGEADMRSDISYGNGVYKSVDGGKTWSRIGLTDSRRIGCILIDPKNPEIVFVAALGHAYAANAERGVFRSEDGGQTWRKVLFTNANTGAIDLAFEPGNPKTILAALWQTRRPPWNVYAPSNGPGSGLYRSDDGGDTWRGISGHGFPAEGLGRIGIAYAPSQPRRVYAIVDAKEGGLYVSNDDGENWTRASSDHRIWGRGWYFGGVTVDPKNADVVYVCDTAMYRSEDGGKTFVPVKAAPGGDDYHQLWIDQNDPSRMIVGSDQGAVVSLDRARTWSSWYNQPTAQFYHVATDDRFPYWIYGAQQDSGAAATPSRSDYRSIMERDWRPIAVGDENGYLAPDPADPRIVFGGFVGRFDWETLQEQNIDPTLAYPGEYRRTWTLPLTFSPRNPHALYYANQFLFKTTDGGGHWEKISPDLTRENPPVPASLDPETAKDSSVSGARRGVIYTIAISPVRDGLIFCGTDDGKIWRTDDDGKRWNDVTPEELTPWSKVGIIEASHFDADEAYAAVDRHRLDDFNPHIYRTRDAGKTWSPTSLGIPSGSYVNAVREDPARRGLLYAGTETGVFVSFDDGDHWQSLQLNLPNCSIRDLDARHGDLVVATHGRSFWVLDDLSPLRQLDGKVAQSDLWLFAPRNAVRLHPAAFQGTPEPKDEPMGENPPSGAIIDYYLKSAATTPVEIDIVDAKGGAVAHFSSKEEAKGPDLEKIVTTPDWVPVSEPPPATDGMHRFVWDLHLAAPKLLAQGRSSFFGGGGLLAPPGRYTVRLAGEGRTWTQPLEVVKDPRIPASDADLVRQFELARRVEHIRVKVAGAVKRAASLRKEIAGRNAKTGKAARELDAFSKKLDEIAGPAGGGFEDLFGGAPGSASSLRRLSASLIRLQMTVESADAAPTKDAVAAAAERGKAADEAVSRFEDLVRRDLPKLNRALRSAGLEAIRGE